MNKFFAFFLIIPAISFADVKMIEKTISANDGKSFPPLIITTYIKDNKILRTTDTKPVWTYSIEDLDNQKIYMIYPSSKTVTIQNRGDQIKFTGNTQKNPVLKKTETSAVVNGFKCQIYTQSEDTGIANICVTQDINLEAFGGTVNDIIKIIGGPTFPSEIKGFPVQIEGNVNIGGRKASYLRELQSISYDALPDDLFKIPPDYKVETINNK